MQKAVLNRTVRLIYYSILHKVGIMMAEIAVRLRNKNVGIYKNELSLIIINFIF